MQTLSPNEIDELMNRIETVHPSELNGGDIDKVIIYQRQARANFMNGVKPVKPATPKISIQHLLKKLVPEKPKSEFKRRV